MKITEEWIKKNNVCMDGVEWFYNNKPFESDVDLIKKLHEDDHFDWSIWFVIRLFNRKQNLMFSIFYAESVLPMFEKKYPDDDWPRKNIDGAKKVLKNYDMINKRDSYAVVASASTYAAAAYAEACDAVDGNIKNKIIDYAIKLLKGEDND